MLKINKHFFISHAQLRAFLNIFPLVKSMIQKSLDYYRRPYTPPHLNKITPGNYNTLRLSRENRRTFKFFVYTNQNERSETKAQGAFGIGLDKAQTESYFVLSLLRNNEFLVCFIFLSPAPMGPL